MRRTLAGKPGQKAVHVELSPQEVEAIRADQAALLAETPARALRRLVIADRMTDAEVATVAAMQSGNAQAKRFWLRWVSALEIQPDDAATVAGFEAVFGKARAAELLADVEEIQ